VSIRHIVKTSSSYRDSHECFKIREHRGAMLIHAHRSTTLSNDRKTENRLDLGATPPPGPIKEGYPCILLSARACTHACMHADIVFLSFFFSPRIPYVSYEPPLHTGGIPLYEGFYRAPGVSPPLPFPTPLPTRLSSCPSLAPICIGTYMPPEYVCIYVYTRKYGNSPPSPEICK